MVQENLAVVLQLKCFRCFSSVYSSVSSFVRRVCVVLSEDDNPFYMFFLFYVQRNILEQFIPFEYNNIIFLTFSFFFFVAFFFFLGISEIFMSFNVGFPMNSFSFKGVPYYICVPTCMSVCVAERIHGVCVCERGVYFDGFHLSFHIN